MNAFRYYTVQLALAAGEQSWTFAESAGQLAWVDASPALPRLLEHRVLDEVSGADIDIVLHGDPYARRMLPAPCDPLLRLTRLFIAQARIRAGVMLSGLYKMRFFRYADELDVSVTAQALSEDQRMNLLAEAMLGAWQDLYVESRPRLLAVAGIDPRITELELHQKLGAWYGRAAQWSTRVVGFKFRAHRFLPEEAGRETPRLHVGDACLLVREHHNRHDPNAVTIIHQNGEKLGYLRCDIAALVAPHIDRGAVFTAHVGAFLPRGFHPDERVYLVVERASTQAAMAA
ncbi:MAG: HIRAN domain-containing protein [Candidatus Lernaella stagnicola]|nr:HIRAN domain-containing protein [Candidatus Lernaella stagnicola]